MDCCRWILLFVVSVTDSKGRVTDSTRPYRGERVEDQDYFLRQRDTIHFFVGQVVPAPAETPIVRLQPQTQCSRRRNSTASLIVAVEAAYFVSGYETVDAGRTRSPWLARGRWRLYG